MNTLAAFDDIPDDKCVTQYKSEDSALAHLLRQYQKYALRLDSLPNVSTTLTGRDLKAAIATMDNEVQVQLAYFYYLHKGALNDAEQESIADKEERQFRHWIVKVVLLSALAMFAVGVGAVGTFMFRYNNAEASGTLISNMFSTAADLAKILLSMGGK